MFKTALPCVGSMDQTVAREWLVRQHYRPWKIAMGIVTPRTHASKRGGALTKWTEDKHHGLVGRNRETRVGSGRDLKQATSQVVGSVKGPVQCRA